MSSPWSEPLDALFVSPHPDDVELFCGGTIARLVAAGRRVGIVDLTAGERASNGSAEGRRSESLDAARALGVELPRVVLGIPDRGVDAEDDEQIETLFGCVRVSGAALVFVPHPLDRHPDHVAAGHLGRRVRERSTVGAGESAGKQGKGGSVPSLEALVEYMPHREFEPQLLVDVSEFMDTRRRAVAAYASQFVRRADSVATPINEPDFVEGMERRLAGFGAGVGAEYAEGFRTDRPDLVRRFLEGGARE